MGQNETKWANNQKIPLVNIRVYSWKYHASSPERGVGSKDKMGQNETKWDEIQKSRLRAPRGKPHPYGSGTGVADNRMDIAVPNRISFCNFPLPHLIYTFRDGQQGKGPARKLVA